MVPVVRHPALLRGAVNRREVQLVFGRAEVEHQVEDGLLHFVGTAVGFVHLINNNDGLQSEFDGLLQHETGLRHGAFEGINEQQNVVEARAKEVGAPFHYAPDLADESEIPTDFSLSGSFNHENAITAIASLKVLAAKGAQRGAKDFLKGFENVIWPGRFQKVGSFIVDGAHNPPAARALRATLEGEDFRQKTLDLICGFCGDKDVDEVLSILAPLVKKGYAVRTNNPRSLSAEETAAKMRAVGIDATVCPSLLAAIEQSKQSNNQTIICGSLFLAGEALVELGAYPWGTPRFDKSELLKV